MTGTVPGTSRNKKKFDTNHQKASEAANSSHLALHVVISTPLQKDRIASMSPSNNSTSETLAVAAPLKMCNFALFSFCGICFQHTATRAEGLLVVIVQPDFLMSFLVCKWKSISLWQCATVSVMSPGPCFVWNPFRYHKTLRSLLLNKMFLTR